MLACFSQTSPGGARRSSRTTRSSRLLPRLKRTLLLLPRAQRGLARQPLLALLLPPLLDRRPRALRPLRPLPRYALLISG
jgi:hypothetical protein